MTNQVPTEKAAMGSASDRWPTFLPLSSPPLLRTSRLVPSQRHLWRWLRRSRFFFLEAVVTSTIAFSNDSLIPEESSIMKSSRVLRAQRSAPFTNTFLWSTSHVFSALITVCSATSMTWSSVLARALLDIFSNIFRTSDRDMIPSRVRRGLADKPDVECSRSHAARDCSESSDVWSDTNLVFSPRPCGWQPLSPELADARLGFSIVWLIRDWGLFTCSAKSRSWLSVRCAIARQNSFDWRTEQLPTGVYSNF